MFEKQPRELFYKKNLLHQMEKEIIFLNEELKSKNTITLLLENVVTERSYVENRSIPGIMTSKLLSRKKITLNLLSQLKQ